MQRPTLWLTDWGDQEQADFEWAWREAGIVTRVVRSRPLGPTVGTRLHRARSWPAYLRLASRGVLRARRGPIVAWQPLAGALAAIAPRPRGTRLVLLNPILGERQSATQRLVLKALSRSDRVVFYTRESLELAVRLGVDRELLRFVPLGVRARVDAPGPPGSYLVAAGRDARDWDTLAAAVRGTGLDVVVSGPQSLPADSPLRLAQPGTDFFQLVRDSAGMVLPFARTDRAIGQLSMLAAMSVGRGIVATSSPGADLYLQGGHGLTVPPRDIEALRAAMLRLAEPDISSDMGEAALKAARERFSLRRFVQEIEAEARGTPQPSGSSS
jgi:glycosyltransferase involved in cell wall biosynthesis